MKVLMTADAVGGVWTYALELSGALARHDIAVVLATMGPLPDTAQRDNVREHANVTLACSEYKLEWMPQPWDDVERAGRWLQELAERESVDLVHLNGYVHAALPWQCPVISVAHSCVCSWWQAVHQCAPPREWQTYRDKVAAGLEGADRIVAPTRAFLEQIQQIYRPTVPTCVIHNARAETFCAGAQPHEREALIFACGRLWDEAKSMRVLDTAVRELPWPTYVAGSLVAPHGAHFHVTSLRCLGELAPRDVAGWLKRATIFVHPARYEPFGLAVLEAALAGCALVLSDLPTLRELWHGAALFVAIDDAAALNRALHTLIAEPQRVRYLSQAARVRAQQYRPELMGNAYASLYQSLLSPSARAEQAVA
jgi:glycogen synthase